MNVLTKQEETRRLREQTYGCQGWRMEEGIVGEFRMDMYTLLYLIFFLIYVLYWSIVDIVFQVPSKVIQVYMYMHFSGYFAL